MFLLRFSVSPGLVAVFVLLTFVCWYRLRAFISGKILQTICAFRSDFLGSVFVVWFDHLSFVHSIRPFLVSLLRLCRFCCLPFSVL
ncbi:hypothetical protein BDY21DRAFT_378415 [Lineolata rhizophorae]|uniref:Uncharacterized protein n=1 Tax=Lineolata rhizophorae TaxID=578093 RepID=A0A6A6P3S6_9PEZI|nr:hypothetical protein BDY21DRAFT_378415 [Lineolata rhizophorae]